ncbi:CLUMA_CG010129, isoform A [Clunio marinus]|uniref:CLUMA_CG010129, isoform A n=1 Tax=Clunio marinus TaxID=568069 RepID=A0A1J1I9F2_9DIPT|nr:CLUMA_CG010129, isoform A [Clunio marinus]
MTSNVYLTKPTIGGKGRSFGGSQPYYVLDVNVWCLLSSQTLLLLLLFCGEKLITEVLMVSLRAFVHVMRKLLLISSIN